MTHSMAASTSHSVFISYRRVDAGGWPGRLERQLIDRFGSERVFRDIRIPAGVDYEDHIERVLDECSVLIAMIGPDWATSSGAHGIARIDQPDDLLREEIERALRRPDVTVIPVLVEGAVMPAAADLPASMSALAKRQAIVLTDQAWDHDVNILIERLSGLLGEKPSFASRVPRRPAVVLATLCTAVVVGTGMFAIRDSLLPGQSSTAGASMVSYQKAVGKICTHVNMADRQAAADARRLKRRLRTARDILEQRDALLDAVRRTNAGTAYELSQFKGLSSPTSLTRRHRSTLAAWSANQRRVVEYQRRLDGAGGRPRLLASIRYLASIRPKLARGGIDVRAGLVNLGGARCRLAAPIVTSTIRLPPLPASPTTAPGSRRAADVAPVRRRRHRPTAARRAGM